MVVPYCGEAPAPAELLARWNADPLVLAALAAGAAWLALAPQPRVRRSLVLAGLAVLAIDFVSPLCALSSALFSARVTHHALLVAVAAPLFAWGLAAAGPRQLGIWPSAAVHAAALWFWHAPQPYAAALSSDGLYWLMQISLFGSALLFWRAVRVAPPIAGAAALLATMMQTGLLGALITFAGEPLYAPYLLTTTPWGLSALADQQLAGLVMWVPMAGVYLTAALAIVGRSLGPDTARGAVA